MLLVPATLRPICCRYCGQDARRTRGSGPRRGLCGSCYNRPALRRRFPPAPYPRVPSSRPAACRHCQRSLTGLSRVRRGLCGSCFANLAIRAGYGYLGTLAGLNGPDGLPRPNLYALPGGCGRRVGVRDDLSSPPPTNIAARTVRVLPSQGG